MLTLRGRLTGPQGATWEGIRVAVTFAELAIEPVTGEEPVWLTAGRVAAVEPDGRFRTDLAEEGRAREPIRVLVVAPNGAVLGRANPTIPELANDIVLEVVPPESFDVPDRPDDPVRGQRIRLSGRVLDSDGGTVDSGLTVVLWGIPAGGTDTDARPLLSTVTSTDGYFGGDWPADSLSRAFGVVAGGEPVPVPLEDGRLPRRVLLVTDLPARPAPADDEDCACADAGPPRAPDPQDLVAEPAAFSQDAGGRCVDFTVPNRVLEEFRSFAVVRTSQPDIKGLTLTPPRPLPRPLVKGLAAAALKLQAASDVPGLRGRALTGAGELELPGVDVPLVLQRALDDGDALLDAGVVTGFLKGPATLSPASLAKIEHVSRFREVADAIRVIERPDPGRAPLTAANPIDWDDEPTTYQATTVAHGHLLHFKEVWRADGYSLGDLLYSLPLAPAQRKNIAVVDWDRTETSERLAARTAFERLEASLVRDRDISEVIATSLTESVRGGSTARTWAVAGGLGAFIGPIVIGAAAGASGSSSTAWQNSARSVAGSTLQQLRDRTVQAASAVRGQRSTVVQTVRQGETMRVQTEVVANYNHCHALTMEYFEVLRHFQVSHELTGVQECLFVPLLMSFFDADKILRWRDDLVSGLRRPELRGGFDAVHRVRSNWVDADVPAGRYADESLLDIDGELWLSFSLPRPADASDGQFDAGAWAPYAPFLAQPAQTIWNTHIAIEAKANRDRVWNTRIAPRVAARIADTLGFQLVLDDGTVVEPLNLDTTLVSTFRQDTPLLVSLRPETSVPAVARSRVRAVRITAPATLPGPARLIVTSASMRYRTAHLSHPLFRGYRVDNDLDASDAVTIPTPLDLIEKRNPRERDRDQAEKLIAHINEHVEHYHLVIWLRMHPNRRYLLLDGFAAPNAGGRSVATVVENRVIGIVGNCLVLPVAPGVKLDPSYTEDPERPVDLLDLYAPTTPIPPVRVSVPTRGVFAEAVLGSCNSCEVKDETRFWRWEEAPIPGTPAAIEAVSAASRRAAPPDLRPDEFPTPLVQIQNAPAAPDPTGLAAALGLIGTPNLFRDITGLDLNQRNAAAAFQGAMETAQFFGLEGAKLAQVRSLNSKMDKTLKSIKDARDRGLISKERAGQLAESALRGSIGERRPAESPPTGSPAVQRVLDKAAQSPSSDVTVSRPNGSVTVRTGTKASGAIGFQVDPTVPFVRQPSALTCWAAVGAMMVSWRKKTPLSIEDALGGLGGPWKDRFEHREGLAFADMPRFAEAIGLVGEAPANHLPRGIRNLLETGPLWVVADEDLTENDVTHAIVVTGISGDGTVDGTRLHINDPVRSGPSEMTFTDFVARLEAPDTVASGLGIYHFPG